MRTFVFLVGSVLLQLGVGGCAPGPEEGRDAYSDAQRILAGARRAVGRPNLTDLVQLTADASVEGPEGRFRTLIHSSSDGRVRMEQPHNGFVAGVGASGGWRIDQATDGVVGLGNGLSYVRGHELHMLSLLPAYLSPAGDPRRTRLDSVDVLSVPLTFSERDTIDVHLRASDTLPIGLVYRGTEPDVHVSWRGWTRMEGALFFRQAVFRQGEEIFRYDYDRLAVAPIDDDVFEPPRSR